MLEQLVVSPVSLEKVAFRECDTFVGQQRVEASFRLPQIRGVSVQPDEALGFWKRLVSPGG